MLTMARVFSRISVTGREDFKRGGQRADRAGQKLPKKLHENQGECTKSVAHITLITLGVGGCSGPNEILPWGNNSGFFMMYKITKV